MIHACLSRCLVQWFTKRTFSMGRRHLMHFWLKCSMVQNSSIRNGYDSRLHVLRSCFYYHAKRVKSFAVERSSSTNNSQAELPYFLKYGKRIQPMQYEGLITFLLLQLIAMATEPHYAAIICRHCFCADSTSNLVEWNRKFWFDCEIHLRNSNGCMIS